MAKLVKQITSVRITSDTYEKLAECAHWKETMDDVIARILDTHEHARRLIKAHEAKKTSADAITEVNGGEQKK